MKNNLWLMRYNIQLIVTVLMSDGRLSDHKLNYTVFLAVVLGTNEL